MGAHVFTFERLGYARLREEIELLAGDRLDVGLRPRPVLLEGLTVSASKLAEAFRSMAERGDVILLDSGEAGPT